MSNAVNTFCICGTSGTGKSTSLENLEEHSKWLHLNTEGAGKPIPFRNQFQKYVITNPLHVISAIENIDEVLPDSKGIIIDSLTFLMDMFETQFIYKSSDSRSAWGDYQQFFKTLIQEKAAEYGKPIIFTAHTASIYDEELMAHRTAIPVKGALKNNGIEAYFTTVIATKVMNVKDLEPYRDNGLLHITEEEEDLGVKHVFQTRLTRDTLHERIKTPRGLFSREQTYIDNDAQLVINQINEFYQ